MAPPVTRLPPPRVLEVKVTGTGAAGTTTAAPFPPPSLDAARADRLTGRKVVEEAFRTAPVGDSRLEVAAEKKRLAMQVLLAAMALDSSDRIG